MSAFYFFDTASRILVSVYSGRTDPAQTRQMRRARAADTARASAVAHVIDMTEHEGSRASPSEEVATISRLGAAYADTYGSLPTVIIATRPHVFGEARVFEQQALAADPSGRIRAVASWDEAAEFLQLDLTGTRALADRRRRAAPPDAPETLDPKEKA